MDFCAANEEALLDLYFDELAKSGGASVDKGTEERAMWMEL